ncbi:translesion DNA synthesis-associated protein ImuA [Variovorax beijingensis]|uniref:Translesion DNA synthesis-associated protein ImuA n=1 Tax=Variovorax beijingensis TaxID=2496117 RepID=A0ABY0A7X3_9BURK|nr:translesion DNA synthesis-associated protein ImuA [Variovorax beijingensis]
MAIPLSWADGDEAPSARESSPPPERPRRSHVVLPHAVESVVWRGDALGTPVTSTVRTGFERLDAELPGGGWPCQSLTEVLQVQPSVLEWRLLAPAMRTLVAQGRQIVVIGPPKAPHLPGLRHLGLDERHLVWIAADKPVERLWATEQLIKANAAGMLVSWLPQARQEQIRRLQVCAQDCDGPVILCRPAAAEHESSAAPLRLHARFGVDWELRIHLLKRKGPPHEGELTIPSVPGGLEAILTPRLRHPSRLIAARQSRELSHAVGSPSSRQPAGRPAAAH